MLLHLYCVLEVGIQLFKLIHKLTLFQRVGVHQLAPLAFLLSLAFMLGLSAINYFVADSFELNLDFIDPLGG